MKQQLKKILVLVLALCLVQSAVPVMALTPPIMVQFDSLEEIKAYFDMSAGALSGDESEGIREYCSEQEARAVCEAMESLVFPYLEIDGKPAKLGAEWRPESKLLEVIYVVDEIQFRFTYYFFNEHRWGCEEPAVRDVQAGPYQLDFKRSEHPNLEYWYLSGVREGSTYVRFWIASDREDCLNYERFSFVHLSELEEEKQESKDNRWLLIAGGILSTVALAGVIILIVLRKIKAQKNEQTLDE